MNDAPSDTVPAFPFIELREVFHILDHQDELPWTYFRDGIDIHRFYGDGIHGPSAALIRFRREARVPLHMHTGWEHILVLAGSQRDQNGLIGPGTLRVHAPGTYHSVVSDAGCIVLAIYEKPVKFLEPGSSEEEG